MRKLCLLEIEMKVRCAVVFNRDSATQYRWFESCKRGAKSFNGFGNNWGSKFSDPQRHCCTL